MLGLIHHNHKLGKMFSAPSHAVKTEAGDLVRVDLPPLWREEAFPTGPGSLRHGSAEAAEAPRKVERFSHLSTVYFWAVLVTRFQLEPDGSNSLQNKHARSPQPSHFVVSLYHSGSRFPPCEREHLPLSRQQLPRPLHPPTPTALQTNIQMKARVRSALMSWPTVMDCSLLQLYWNSPVFFFTA